MYDTMGISVSSCTLLLLISSCNSISLETSLKMAQCRAHCINKLKNLPSIQEDNVCKQDTDCSMCWQTCDKLSRDFPIWSYNCGHNSRCNSGCQTACDFLSDNKGVVPLSHYKSRLTLIFGSSSAQWNLVWGTGVPLQKAVFALFTRTTGKPWALRAQTADYGTSLKDLSSGTELKLVAVAESGLLSVIITPFDPPNYRRTLGLQENQYPWNKENSLEGDEKQGWPLFYEASVETSGLVAAKVWWSLQRPGRNFLVTWEVSGGGLKGHLYTDLPEVDLTLWPDTVYKVQVEVVTGPLGELRTSKLLILDTHNFTEDSQERRPYQPLVKRFDSDFKVEVIIGAILGVLAAVAVVSVLLYKRRRCSRRTLEEDASSTNSKLTLNGHVPDFAFQETLVGSKFSSPNQRMSVPSPNTLGIPSSNSFIYITKDCSDSVFRDHHYATSRGSVI